MKLNFVLASILVSTGLFAQNIDDVVRYSQTNTGSTALSMGMGGSTGAVGADFSSASTNPAGLGLFRQSEFAASPSIFNYSGKADYYGTQESDRKFNFNLTDFHLVLHTPAANRLKTKGWMGTTFAIGYSKNNNLSEQWTYRGFNPSNSIVNAFAATANGKTPDDLADADEYLAYQSYLIDNVVDSAGNTSYTSLLGPNQGGITQRGTIEGRGRIGETDIAFAGNYSNRLYLGATLAFRRIVFEQTNTYTERDDLDSLPTFNSLVYTRTLTDKAMSIALRLGAIYRINDYVRIGASAFVPLDYTVNSEYSYDLSSSLSTGDFNPTPFSGTYKYKIRQPARLTGSAAFILGKKGIISVDYEAVNYSQSKLVENAGTFDNTNDAIRTKLQPTANLRVGGEARFDDMYLRGGFQLNGSPYSSSNNNQSIKLYSIGGGYRDQDFYMDVAYVYSQQSKNYYPYNPNLVSVQPVSLSSTRHQVVFTIGTRF
ncbi:MAG TPA: hypothetical protein PL185_11595 [Flavobacteriales bacterium]|nr:hypothetical protein [Flavobacteriales bacterium]